MANTKRSPPAIFERPQVHPEPQFVRFPEFEQPANPVIGYRLGWAPLEEERHEPRAEYQRFPYFREVINPVIAFRYGRAELLRPEAFVPPQYFRFPYFERPASPVIPHRRGRIPDERAKAFVRPEYQRFPYFEQPANPVIGYRYGQDVIPDLEAFVPPEYQRFPKFPEVPANPVIGYRYGRGILLYPERLVVPEYQRFPYFEQPANPVIGYRYGQDILRGLEKLVGPEYQRFPYFVSPANPVIAYRYGRAELLRPEAFVEPRHQRFPYFQEAPASPVIEFLYGRAELLRPEAFVRPEYQRFPYFQEVPIANPFIRFLYGRTELLRPEAFVPARHLEFPYFAIEVWSPCFTPAAAAWSDCLAPTGFTRTVSLVRASEGFILRDQFNRGSQVDVGNGWVDQVEPASISSNTLAMRPNRGYAYRNSSLPSDFLAHTNMHVSDDLWDGSLLLYYNIAQTHWYDITMGPAVSGFRIRKKLPAGLTTLRSEALSLTPSDWYGLRLAIQDNGSDRTLRGYRTPSPLTNGHPPNLDAAKLDVDLQIISTEVTDSDVPSTGIHGYSMRDVFADEFFVCGREITVTGLPTGWKARIDGKAATLTVEVAGTATINVESIALPASLVEVLDDTDTVVHTLSLPLDVWGGDSYIAVVTQSSVWSQCLVP